MKRVIVLVKTRIRADCESVRDRWIFDYLKKKLDRRRLRPHDMNFLSSDIRVSYTPHKLDKMCLSNIYANLHRSNMAPLPQIHLLPTSTCGPQTYFARFACSN